MGDLLLSLFYYFLVTFVVFNVPIRFLFMCERWYYVVMSFFQFVFAWRKKKAFVSTEIHPKPMSSTQGIKSLKALVISIKG